MLSSWYKDYLQTVWVPLYELSKRTENICIQIEGTFRGKNFKILHPEGPERSLSDKWAKKTGPARNPNNWPMAEDFWSREY